jgi:hypothetical protein
VFSPDRQRIVVGDRLPDFEADVMNAANFEVLSSLKGTDIHNPVFSRDGERIVTFGYGTAPQEDGILMGKR